MCSISRLGSIIKIQNVRGLRVLIITEFGNIILKVYEIELNMTHLSKRILMQKKKKMEV